MNAPTFETEKVHVSLLENSIFKVVVKEDVELDLIDLDLNYFFFKVNIPKEKVPFLIVFGKGATTVKGATEKFSEQGRLEMKKKEALVLATLPHRIMANLYLRLAKPKHPTKIFSQETDALKWLRE